MEELYKRLEEVRAEKGLSQAEFAKRLGISYQSYVKYQKGSVPSSMVIRKASEEFDVNPRWVLIGIGEKYIPTPPPEFMTHYLLCYQEIEKHDKEKGIVATKNSKQLRAYISLTQKLPALDIDPKSKKQMEEYLSKIKPMYMPIRLKKETKPEFRRLEHYRKVLGVEVSTYANLLGFTEEEYQSKYEANDYDLIYRAVKRLNLNLEWLLYSFGYKTREETITNLSIPDAEITEEELYDLPANDVMAYFLGRLLTLETLTIEERFERLREYLNELHGIGNTMNTVRALRNIDAEKEEDHYVIKQFLEKE